MSQTVICIEPRLKLDLIPVLGECSLNAPEKYWDQKYLSFASFSVHIQVNSPNIVSPHQEKNAILQKQKRKK